MVKQALVELGYLKPSMEVQQGGQGGASRRFRIKCLAFYNFPMTPDPISEAVRLAKAAIADFEVRMREVTPAYQRGDRVELHGEVFEVSGYQREGMPGYWLRGETENLFLPLDLEGQLRPVVH